tara:strand:- start:6923 stop:7537 length:615 start_codon:yes stop_codon:yes gene_type:complete
MSFDAFTPTINESVWGSLMQQTSSVSSQDTSYKNADGNLVRKKFKAPLRDAVKNLIGFLQHKQGQVKCDALDISIAEGNRLLGLDKNGLESELESQVDFNVTNSRRKYGAQMLQQYTNELEKKRNKNCRVGGDKAVDYAQQDVQAGYDALGYTPPPSGSTNYQQAGIGGNMMVYLTIGAIAFAGFFFIKSMSGKQGATAPAPSK